MKNRPQSESATAGVPARAPAAPDLAIEFCPNCSMKLVGHSCKMKCPRCGYFLSCSDYY